MITADEVGDAKAFVTPSGEMWRHLSVEPPVRLEDGQEDAAD